MIQLLRVLALVVPGPVRERWREEWTAELSAVRRARGRGAALSMAAGATRDAIALRREVRCGLGRSVNPLRGATHDLRDVWRSLASARWFAISVVASLGFGIAGMVTAFTFANGLLFRPFPGVREQNRLVRVNVTANQGHRGRHVGSLDDYLMLRNAFTTLSGLTAQTTGDIAVRIDGRAESIRAAMVSDNYFDVLGVTPSKGRFLSDAQLDREGIVISHSAWIGRFGSRADIIGCFVELGTYGHARILGVAPPGFVGSSRSDVGLLASPVEMWMPIEIGRRVLPSPGPGTVLPTDDPETRRDYIFTARLAPGVTRAAAQAEAGVVASRLAARPDRSDAEIRFEPVTWGHVEQQMAFVGALLSVPALVLVIGCVNAANLLLARGTQRGRERAVRMALGASRWRVVRPMLIESFVLSAMAVLGSLVLARWAMSLVRGFIDLPMPVDGRVITFAVFVATASTLVFALLPSLRLSAVTPGRTLGPSRDSDAPKGSRARQLMIVAQVALSAGLLATGTQLLAFLPAHLPSSGTPSDQLLLVTLDTSQLRMTVDESSQFFQRVLDTVSGSREADGVGLARAGAVWTFGWTRGYSQVVVGRPEDSAREAIFAVGGFAGGDLFKATGQRLVAGRLFDPSDRGGRPNRL